MDDEAPEPVAEVLAEEVNELETCCAACEARFSALTAEIEELRNQIAALEEYDDGETEESEPDDSGDGGDVLDIGPGDEPPATTHWFFRKRSFFG